jgi:cytochrome c oxidase subunit 2
VIGPDLTHVGARRSIAAGTLATTADALGDFIHDPAAIKPGVLMPSFRNMPPADRAAIATYLTGLR